MQFTSPLDWGDAVRADPAAELAKLPLRAMLWALEGYAGEAGPA